MSLSLRRHMHPASPTRPPRTMGVCPERTLRFSERDLGVQGGRSPMVRRRGGTDTASHVLRPLPHERQQALSEPPRRRRHQLRDRFRRRRRPRRAQRRRQDHRHPHAARPRPPDARCSPAVRRSTRRRRIPRRDQASRRDRRGPALYRSATARANLRIQAAALGLPDDRRRDDELVGLSGRGDDRPRGYSLGMRQRLGIAITLVGAPELLILDEPTNGLDPSGIVEVRELLRTLPERGVTVLVSSASPRGRVRSCSPGSSPWPAWTCARSGRRRRRS
jgi:hypothetical protein